MFLKSIDQNITKLPEPDKVASNKSSLYAMSNSSCGSCESTKGESCIGREIFMTPAPAN